MLRVALTPWPPLPSGDPSLQKKTTSAKTAKCNTRSQCFIGRCASGVILSSIALVVICTSLSAIIIPVCLFIVFHRAMEFNLGTPPYRSVGVLFVGLFLIANSGAAKNLPCSHLSSRIPRGIIPTAYRLHLHPRLLEGSFTGFVHIIFDLKTSMRCIPVHTNGLVMLRTELHGPNGNIPLASLFEMPEFNYWVSEARQDLEPGQYNLSLRFTGHALNKMNGFYRSSYRLPNETSDRLLMTTKFEPTDARQAFPCFDEPILKARFTISIVRPNNGNYMALSNSKAVREYPGPNSGEVTTEFEETPSMSTYLVAAIVSDFRDLGPLPVQSGDKVIPLRVFATPNLVNATAFARSVGQAVLEYFVQYFDIPFPLPKMDMIAIPDFISGAMENWGLITYRETKLVVTENTRSFNSLRKIAHTVSHELSHQWFGNLVTMKWWDDLWLNEGFARFMEYKGVGALTDENTQGPLVRLEDSPDLLDLKMNVMVKDALLNSHPIVMKVSKPEQISEIFDSISYAKGASILMMIEHIMGEDAFRLGVQKYLKNHAFGNAASVDLLSALSHQANMSLTESIPTWTKQMGFPVVNVRKTVEGYELTQQRFVSDNTLRWSPDTSPFGYKWDIPVCYRTANSDSPRMIWLGRKDKKVVLTSRGEPWVKFNCKGAAFYRTNYDYEMWDQLTNLLRSNSTALDAEDRANLLDDSFALANAGYLDYSVPLKLSGYLRGERVRLALAAGFSQLSAIKGKIGQSSITGYIRRLAKTLYQAILGDRVLDFTKNQLKREEEFYILHLGCKMGLKRCRDAVSDHFRQWINNEITIVPDLRALVYSTGMKSVGTDDDWKLVLDKYRNELDPQEKELLMASLVATKNDHLLKKLLSEGLRGSLVRAQDFFAMLGRVGVASPRMAWQWYKDHYEELVAKFGLSDKGLGRSLESITGRFRSKSKLNDLKKFLQEHREGGSASMARRRATEKIQSNMNWVERAKSIHNYFSDSVNRQSVRTTPTPAKTSKPHKRSDKG